MMGGASVILRLRDGAGATGGVHARGIAEHLPRALSLNGEREDQQAEPVVPACVMRDARLRLTARNPLLALSRADGLSIKKWWSRWGVPHRAGVARCILSAVRLWETDAEKLSRISQATWGPLIAFYPRLKRRHGSLFSRVRMEGEKNTTLLHPAPPFGISEHMIAHLSILAEEPLAIGCTSAVADRRRARTEDNSQCYQVSARSACRAVSGSACGWQPNLFTRFPPGVMRCPNPKREAIGTEQC